ncbi:MAG: TrkH family potassium uptake protein [Lentimicrobiaceae bacterium]|jgi:trk system potassium uptake protein TrkH|nr:TrkH family potassium uptake protein [Lentimicrobiaceae bacterium]
MNSFVTKTNYSIIARIIGILLMIEGLFMLSALPITFIYCGYDCYTMPLSSLITFSTGFVLFLFNRKVKKEIGKRDGYITVVLVWIVFTLFGSLPYLISESIPRFTDAFFETISGFTTTGSTILIDIEALPKDILYWRSLTQWLGGIGIIVLTVAILPFLGIGGFQLYIAEMPGVTYDKLHPRITVTAKRIWAIYIVFTLAQIGLLCIGDMPLYDSICHALTTVSSGGFSIYNNSIASCSVYSQYIIIFFMIFAGTNFALHYFALHLKFKKIFHNEEYRMYLTIIGVFTLIIAIGLIIAGNLNFETAFRESLFTVTAILTTTGYAITNYLLWPPIFWMLIVVLMFIGGCAGSTSGGMKIVRPLLLIRNSRAELRRSIHPNAVLPVKLNGRTVPMEIIYKIMAFFSMYILTFVVGVIGLSAFGLDFETAIGASISSVGNIGLAIGDVGPVESFAFMPDAAKWTLGFLMLLGRLELFTVLILFSPYFWKK